MNVNSSGVLLWRYRTYNLKEYFLVSPGGPLFGDRLSWGPPKGHMELGETPWETAKREFFEETGHLLEGIQDDYVYEGFIKQRSNKHVHIFSRNYLIDINPKECFSNTFTWIDGRDYPEIDKYSWLTIEEIGKNGVKAYMDLINKIELR